MSSVFNLTMFAGETRTLVVTVTDQDGAAVDLTDADITYVLDLATPITKTVGSGITITGALAGEFEIALAQADTVAIDTDRSIKHECKALLQSGEVLTVFYGTVVVKDSQIGAMT